MDLTSPSLYKQEPDAQRRSLIQHIGFFLKPHIDLSGDSQGSWLFLGEAKSGKGGRGP